MPNPNWSWTSVFFNRVETETLHTYTPERHVNMQMHSCPKRYKKGGMMSGVVKLNHLRTLREQCLEQVNARHQGRMEFGWRLFKFIGLNVEYDKNVEYTCALVCYKYFKYISSENYFPCTANFPPSYRKFSFCPLVTPSRRFSPFSLGEIWKTFPKGQKRFCSHHCQKRRS